MQTLYNFLLKAKDDRTAVFLALPMGILTGDVDAVNTKTVKIYKPMLLTYDNIWFQPDESVFVVLDHVSMWSNKDIRPKT